MSVASLPRVGLVLGIICFLGSCRDQDKAAGRGALVAVPENFEIDFDSLFDLKKPCEMTPALLEAKVAALAVIPREKLCKPVKFPQESCHYQWFSPKDAPVHNPAYSIFKSQIRPNFVSVVWQDQEMERFYCVYPAEKDQDVPSELLADMDRSLEAARRFNASLKQFEWELEHYLVSAQYSTSVGKGDPSFLVNVRNKRYRPKLKIAAPGAQALKVNIDDFFDWKKPKGVDMAEFQAKMQSFQAASGRNLRISGTAPDQTYYFDPPVVRSLDSFTLAADRYQASSAFFSWKGGHPFQINVFIPPMQSGKEIKFSEEVAYLDKYLGVPHSEMNGDSSLWLLPDFHIRFLKSSRTTDYVLYIFRGVPTPVASVASSGNSPATVPPSAPAVSPAANPAFNQFKLRLTQVNGLLISPLSSGEEAGQVTRLTLTALPNRGQNESWIEFNQDVGGSMLRSLNEVSKHSQIRHDVWPRGYTLQVGFDDKYVEKDGPSAAVACALLVESAITGRTWDPAFAVTGDLNADGSVQPIGGVRAKIRGATKGSCKLVAVPAKNERAVADIVLLDGPAPLVGITVFGIKTFDDALLLANSDRSHALNRALADFDAMRTVMMRDPKQIMPLLRTPHAIARLQALLAAAPNCYSAKYLLLHAQGRSSRVLSLGGSIEAAQSSAQAISSSIDNDIESNVSSLRPDEVGNSLSKLRSLRPLLDQRVWPYVDGLLDYGEVIRGAIINPVRSGARYKDLVTKAGEAAGRAKAAFRFLMNSAEVREELGL